MGSWELPGYDVLDRLGAGGVGEVWRARDRATGETVVLKRVRCTDAAAAARLREDVSLLERVAAGSPGQHLLRVRATVAVPDGLVLVQDHAAGGSLASVLAARGRLAPGEVVTVGVPIAGALAVLHAAGETHGGVSAGNVLFTVEGRPLLADVAVARRLRPFAQAPEAEPADDVYALAAVCWVALGGAPPEPGAALPATPAGVPSALAAAVRLGLAPDPAARPTAAAWAASLRSACAPAPVRLVRRVAAPGERVPPAGGSTRPQTTAPSPPAAAPPRSSAPDTPLPSHPPARHRRGHHRLLARALAAALLAAAAVVVGTALSRVDRASTASPVPRAPVSTPSVDPRPVDWRAVLAGLDTRRTEAFATGESLALARVYAPGSLPLARDTDALRRLVAAGVTVPRLRLEVSEVGVVSAQPARAVLRVVDRLPAHDLVARDGSVREHRPGRGRRAWRITPVAADAEWRISAVEPAAY